MKPTAMSGVPASAEGRAPSDSLSSLALDAAPDLNRIRHLFDSQGRTALAWRRSTASERIDRIRRLRDALHTERALLLSAFEHDLRKSPMEVDGSELLPVLAEARHAIRHLRTWMHPRRAATTPLTLTNRAWVEYQPRGRALVISPWNFPVNLSLGPIISALAAGDPVILKPSELTPTVSAALARIVAAAFAEDEVAVVEGGLPTSQALLALPFDHIFFTGSPTVGQAVMAAAAVHLSSITLELGGKSPTLVDETADIQRAAENLMWGKLTNAGQICLAPDHVFVHVSVQDAFVAACRNVIATRYGNTPAEIRRSPDLTRIVNARHARRLADLLQDAVDRGARLLCGGEVDVDDCYVAPTLLDQVRPDARIMQEEIFGPLLPIQGYTTLDEVITQINARPKPLALYVWSNKPTHIRQVIDSTSSGGVCINHCMLHSQHGNLPFGGIGRSGLGNAHGWHGFKTFSHERAVLRSWPVMLVQMAYAPYTPLKQWMMRQMVRTLGGRAR